MKIVNSEYRLCTCCMEEHEVKTVRVMDRVTFKGEMVEYEASYFYCDLADEFYMNEQQMQENDTRLKEVYRKKSTPNPS